MKKFICIILTLIMLFSCLYLCVSAYEDETKLKIVEFKCDTLAKCGTEMHKLKKQYDPDEGYIIKLAAYDTDNNLMGVSSADDYRTYLPKDFSKVMAYVWRTYSSNGNNITAVSLQVGVNESEKRLVWYNDQDKGTGKVQIALKSDYENDGGFTENNSKIIIANTEKPHGNDKSISNKAILGNLQLGETYVYRLGGKDTFSDKIYSFKTYAAKNDDKQTFLIVSDLHNNAYTIDSVSDSSQAKTYQDLFNKRILPRHDDIQFIVSTGDNVSQANMPTQFKEYMNSDWNIYREKAELEMEVLFKPSVFQNISFASSLGNHEANNNGNEFGSVTKYHYYLPNDDGLTGTHFSETINKPITHGNFWFRNGDVLLVGITATRFNSNVFNHSQADDHKEYIKKAIEANFDAKWRILINHVPAYSFDGGFVESPLIRKVFADIGINEFGFDAVFTGHSHSYSRTKQILTDAKYVKSNILTYNDDKSDHLKPKVVSENMIEHTTDEKGRSIDIATNPEGAVHINVAPLAFEADVPSAQPDFKDYVEVIVAKKGDVKYNNNPESIITPNSTNAKWHNMSSKSYIAVTVEKLSNGQQMKFELVDAIAGSIYDTYIIKKTSE